MFLAVFRHFLKKASFVLANISYLDGLDHSLHFLLRHHARKKSGHPVFGHFVSKLCVFVPFSNRVIMGTPDMYGSVFMSK